MKKMTEFKGLSGSTLKIIAMVTMLIDHTGKKFGMFDFNVYYVMRTVIGRIAFPIFCFLLVEGFEKTTNRWKYAGRLLLCAIISEIPFNLVEYGKIYGTSHQNVLFTLWIGLFMMWGMEFVWKHIDKLWFRLIGVLPVVGAAAFLATTIHCDYTFKGIISIALLYFFRENKWNQIMAGAVSFYWEPYAILAFIPIGLYNKQRGLKLKYIFYAFYPAHLLILYIISLVLN